MAIPIFALKAAIVGAFAAAAAGAWLTWSELGSFSEIGIESSDGVAVFVFVVAGIAMTVLGRRPRAVLIATSSAYLALIIAALRLIDVAGGGGPDVGSGLYLSVAGSAGAALLCSLQMFAGLRRPAAQPPADEQ